jgi:hypothetical protein
MPWSVWLTIGQHRSPHSGSPMSSDDRRSGSAKHPPRAPGSTGRVGERSGTWSVTSRRREPSIDSVRLPRSGGPGRRGWSGRRRNAGQRHRRPSGPRRNAGGHSRPGGPCSRSRTRPAGGWVVVIPPGVRPLPPGSNQLARRGRQQEGRLGPATMRDAGDRQSWAIQRSETPIRLEISELPWRLQKIQYRARSDRGGHGRRLLVHPNPRPCGAACLRDKVRSCQSGARHNCYLLTPSGCVRR